jgi:hypothetical protein
MDQNAYDFINNAPNYDTGKKKRIIVFVAGIILLLVIVIIFFAVINSGKKNVNQIILPVAGVQADLIALTSAGSNDARESALLNQSTTVGLVVAGQNATINGYLGKDASKLTKTYQNGDYANKLQESTQNGTFDQTYKTILNQRLDLYMQNLVTAYSELPDGKLKQQIAQMHAEAELMAGKQTTPN